MRGVVFVLLLLLRSSPESSVDAFPTGAGSCTAGTTAILTPTAGHATHMQIGDAGESLEFFGLEVTLDGTLLDPSVPADVTVGEPHALAIAATGDAFRGFLMRLEGAMVDTTSALSPTTGDDEFVRVATETCIMINEVGGLTHSNPTRVDLTSVTGVLQLDEPADGLVLDVTVVILNSIMDNVSQWYFSTYMLNAVAAPPSVGPSAAPTILSEAPTTVPVVAESEAPSATPVMAMSEAPTTAPDIADSEAPSATPVMAMSEAPTTAPDMADSEAPSAAPVMGMSEAPTTAPDMADSEAPSAAPVMATMPVDVSTSSPAPTSAPTSGGTKSSNLTVVTGFVAACVGATAAHLLVL